MEYRLLAAQRPWNVHGRDTFCMHGFKSKQITISRMIYANFIQGDVKGTNLSHDY